MPASVCADDETKASAVAASVGVHERGDGAGHGQALGSQSAVDRAGSDAAAGGSGLLDGDPVCGGARGGGQRSACRGRWAAGVRGGGQPAAGAAGKRSRRRAGRAGGAYRRCAGRSCLRGRAGAARAAGR
ncbi:hypothetical protein G6F62_014541 [Rhizopus arrhizus]|nr:hypothetical protein G6F62_014541 [Rhizopus arrhizus]